VHARVPYAAGVIGIAQEALRHAIDWARQRHVHKSVLGDKQAIQWMIADSEIELRAARLLTWQAAWNGELGKDIKTDASVAKVYATEAAGRVIDRAFRSWVPWALRRRCHWSGGIESCGSSGSAKDRPRFSIWSWLGICCGVGHAH
jgi:alkylation response protein AidB-like acyl-CoA dehydrogenase